jgi:hypothetical protein
MRTYNERFEPGALRRWSSTKIAAQVRDHMVRNRTLGHELKLPQHSTTSTVGASLLMNTQNIPSETSLPLRPFRSGGFELSVNPQQASCKRRQPHWCIQTSKSSAACILTRSNAWTPTNVDHKTPFSHFPILASRWYASANSATTLT